jgi:hypothetical protein
MYDECEGCYLTFFEKYSEELTIEDCVVFAQSLDKRKWMPHVDDLDQRSARYNVAATQNVFESHETFVVYASVDHRFCRLDILNINVDEEGVYVIFVRTLFKSVERYVICVDDFENEFLFLGVSADQGMHIIASQFRIIKSDQRTMFDSTSNVFALDVFLVVSESAITAHGRIPCKPISVDQNNAVDDLLRYMHIVKILRRIGTIFIILKNTKFSEKSVHKTGCLKRTFKIYNIHTKINF